MPFRFSFFLSILLLTSFLSTFGQSTNIPLDENYYHLIDRYEIMNGAFASQFHSNVKPFQRKDVAEFVDQLIEDSVATNEVDRFNLEYLSNDNWEWSKYDFNESKHALFKTFYEKKSDLYHIDVKDFDLHINPVIYFSVGKESENNVTNYINTRGLELRGSIADRLGFYSYITTTQAAYPYYVRQSIVNNKVIPGEGFWKNFKSNGVDYFTPRGYISFELIKKYVNAQFGFDRFFIGGGHRSLILSDYAPGYTFLKFNTKIWRINYTNIFAELSADAYGNETGSFSEAFPVKYMAFHHLSINILDNLNFGLFETVMIGDSTERFKMSYLNPIIFYRALEHQDGSKENVILGADATWNIGRHFSFYGQLILDEFVLKEIKAGNGWWANKYGGQIGVKYINAFGIPNLDLQVENNIARPYLHSHGDIYTNFAHYRQPLGDPLGANFKEYIGILRYQPWKRIAFTAQLNYATYGADTLNSNWGKDVMKSYDTREQDYGNVIGQGVATKLFYGDFTFTYQLKHNFFIDFRAIFRHLDSAVNSMDENTTYTSVSVRWNMAKTLHDF